MVPTSIETRGLSFTYPASDEAPRPALASLTMRWDHHDLLLLRGPNGSGKSTLLRLLLGLARPTEGRINVGGVDLFDLDLRAWRRNVAYLPQRPFFPERSNARDAVRLLARDATDATVRRALERVDLWDSLARKSPNDPLSVSVASLSAGQRQRLALARVLAQDARIFLLDEPDANLDAAGILLVARIVRELARDHMVAVAAHTAELVAVGDLVVTLSPGGLNEVAAAPATTDA